MNFRLWDAGQRGLGARVGLATLLLVLCACSGSSPKVVAGSPEIPTWARVQDADAPLPGTWTIELLSDAQLQLGSGQVSPLRVRVTDAAGEPGVGLRLSFALVGLPQDTGLGALDALTDDDGVAQNTLTAGTEPTAFAVRIATPGAESVQIDVSVSTEGFGSFQVTADYRGRRDVSRRIVWAQPRTRCDTPEEQMPFVRVGELVPDSASVLIDQLPAGLTFAVTAIAESPAQTIVARGCIDGILVRAEQVTEVTVEFEDEAFVPVGQFAVRAELDATAPAESLAVTLQHAAEVLVLTDSKAQMVGENAEARFLLDSLEQTLRSGSYATDSEAMALMEQLADARAADDSVAEATLQEALDDESTGPLVAIPRIASVARTSLESISLFAALTLDQDAGQPVVWQTRRIQSLPTVLGGSPPSVDLARLRLAANTRSRFRPAQDALELSSVTFRAQLGALAAEVLPGAIGAVAEADAQNPDPFGCTVLGTWLRDQDALDAEVCDAECLRAVCDQAIARLSEAARRALIALDIARPELQLRGTLRLHDDDGDLLADSMDSDALRGVWLPPVDGGDEDEAAVSGELTATAIDDSTQLP